MLQRPQSLLFILAAILTAITAFAPMSTYKSQKSFDGDPRIVVSVSDVDFIRDYADDLKVSEAKFNKDLDRYNAQMDEEIKKRGLSIFLSIGLLGMLLLSAGMFVLPFLFNNRKLQIRLGLALTLITTGVTLGVYLASRVGLKIFGELDFLPKRLALYDWSISYQYGFFFLPVIITLLIIGVVLVRKDDNLVKSIDRIR